MDLTDTKQSTTVHAEPSPNSHCTISKRLGDPQYGGALFILPREIRDEVYSLVRKGEGGSYTMRKTHCNHIRTQERNFALLAVSKAISQEFFERWLSDPNGGYRLAVLSSYDPVIRLPPKYTNCMKDLRLDLTNCDPYDLDLADLDTYHSFDAVWGTSTEDWETLDPCDSLVKAALAPFTGAHIERNSLEVDLWYYSPDTMAVVLSSPGFETFKALVGFRSVAFRVGAWPVTPKTLSVMLEGIKKALEPWLGPATEDDDYWTVGLVFHPRDKLVEGVN